MSQPRVIQAALSQLLKSWQFRKQNSKRLLTMAIVGMVTVFNASLLLLLPAFASNDVPPESISNGSAPNSDSGKTTTSKSGTASLSKPLPTRPSQTDSRIKTFDEPHFSWLPAASPRNQLLLFLTGTNGKPRAPFPFADTASALGYHVISLMYPDDVAAQQVCPQSSDPNAYMKFRLAIIQGGNFGSEIHIQAADSIENRLAKLLAYLALNQPGAGWEQFLEQQGQIAWQKIAVSGQSQGGGHAYVISKIHEVARVISLGSPKDYSFYFHRPASGFDSTTKTPLNRYFAFNHFRDIAGGTNHDQQMEILKQIGLIQFGAVEIENPDEDFRHAHLIFTNAVVPNLKQQMQYHTCVCSGVLPIDKPVWTYMLSEPVTSAVVKMPNPTSVAPIGSSAGAGSFRGPSASGAIIANYGGKSSVAAQAGHVDEYMAYLQGKIKRAWFPPGGQKSDPVCVCFKVNGDGKMSDLRIEKSTGATISEQAALRAVMNASPFKALPAGMPSVAEIQFDFSALSGASDGRAATLR